MKEIWQIIIAISIMLGTARAQIENQFGRFENRAKEKTVIELEPNKLEIIPPVLEQVIDSNEYVVGPGDIFGVNIDAMENMYYNITVGPTGDLLIPGVGSENISGLILIKGIDILKHRINETFQNARIDISLINIRTFKVQIIGAVNNPGFAKISALTRLDEAIDVIEGLHRYADEKKILIKRTGENNIIVSLANYINTGSLNDNPILKEGDIVSVPYIEENKQQIYDTFKKMPVIVTGFVMEPGAINFFPGYSLQDYIGLAGGVSEIGNYSKAYLIRSGIKQAADLESIVLPGDQIFVPESTLNILFGKNSLLQTVTAFTSLVLTYLAIQSK